MTTLGLKARAKAQEVKVWTSVADQIKKAKAGEIEGRPLEEFLNELLKKSPIDF